MLKVINDKDKCETTIVVSDKYINDNTIVNIAIGMIKAHSENLDLGLYDSHRSELSNISIFDSDGETPKRIVVY